MNLVVWAPDLVDETREPLQKSEQESSSDTVQARGIPQV